MHLFLQMPSANRIFQTEFPIHIVNRSNNKERFPADLSEVWRIFEDYLFLVSKHHGLKILSFVLMPNHFHLLAIDSEGTLAASMEYLMRETAKEINRKSCRINRVWGDSYRASIIPTHHYFSTAYKYVYRNPVEAGLSLRVEDYKFSTLAGLLGQQRCIIPIEEDPLLFDYSEQTLNWLNTAPSRETVETVRLSLRRKEMKFPRDKTSMKRSLLESQLF